MKIHDISVKIEKNMMKYYSLRDVIHTFERDYSKGDNMSLSSISMQMHLGTHLDSPYHYIKEGKRIDEIPLEKFCGKVQVIEINEKEIKAEDIKTKGIKCDKLLFKTPYSKDLNNKNKDASLSYFSEDAADYLADTNVDLIGIDSFSIDRSGDKEKYVHKKILGAGKIALEGINLYDIDEGFYYLYAFPLNIKGAEGAPCRAVLIEGEIL